MPRALLDQLPRLLLLSCGLVLSVVCAGFVAHQDAEARLARFHGEVDVYTKRMQQALRMLVADVQVIARFHDASEQVSAAEFTRFARPFLDRNPSISSLLWVPRVAHAERARFEQEARREGLADFRIWELIDGTPRPARERPEYFPLYRAEPLERSTPDIGFDAGSEPVRRAAIELAWTSAQPVCTTPLPLEPDQRGGRALAIFVPQGIPAFAASREMRRQQLQGFAVGVVWLNDLLDNVVASLPPRGLELELRDLEHPDAGSLALYRPQPERAPEALDIPPATFSASQWLLIAGYTLELHLRAPPGVYPASDWPLVVAVTGLAISIILSSLYQNQRLMRQQRQHNGELFRLFMDHTPAMAWIKDEALRCIYYNKTYEQHFGVRLREARGKDAFDLLPPEQSAGVHAADQAVLEHDQRIETHATVTEQNGHLSQWQILKIPFRDQRGYRYIGAIGWDMSAQHEAKALKEREVRYRSMVEMLSQFIRYSPIYTFIVEVTPQGSRILQASHNLELLLGIPGQTITGKTVRELAPQEMAERIEAQNRQVVTSGRVLRRDDSINGKHYTSIKFPITLDGKTLLAGYAIDMTERKQIELDLRTHQAYLRAVLDSLHDAVFVHDANTLQIIDVNARMCELYGYSREQALACEVGSFSLGAEPYTQERAIEWLHKARERGPQTFEWISRNSNGKPFWLEMSACFVEIAGEGRFIVTAHDMTRRRVLEEALRNEEAKYRMLFESANDGIFLQDAQRFIDCNERGAAMYGLTRAALTGMTPLHFAPPYQPGGERSSTLFEHYVQSALSGQPQRFEWQAQRQDSTLIDVEIHLNCIQIEDATYLQAVVRDISERKKTDAITQRALLEAERLARVRSDFLANMSHEIRTPLNAVLGLAQIGQRTHASHPAEETFGRILDAGQHLLGVIDDTLDFAKIEAGKLVLEPIELELGALIDRVLDLIALRAYHKGLELHIHEAPELPRSIQGDALRLSQVLVNLLSNAIKFTHQGEVSLSVSREQADLVFVVRDSGIGMSAEQLAQLFTPFQQADTSTTRHFGGTGLGLAICKHLVDLMGGTIEVESEPGAGSAFRVQLPLVAPRPPGTPVQTRVALVGLAEHEAQHLAPALEARGAEVIELAPKAEWPEAQLVLAAPQALTMQQVERAQAAQQIVSILITPGVEDPAQAHWETLPRIERPLRARQVLALLNTVPSGARSHQATDARLAGLHILAAEDNVLNRLVLEDMLHSEGASVTCFENGRELLAHLAEHTDADYALLLTDIQMPELNGYETARLCRKHFPELPVVGLTAHAMPEERARCFAAGMVEHLTKPLDHEHLVRVILHLNRHRAETPPEARPSSEAPQEPAPPVSASEALIDWAALEARYATRPAFLEHLIGLAVDTQAQTAQHLREAVHEADLMQVSTLAHEIKGMSANLLSMPLHALAAATEQAVHELDPEALSLAEQLASLHDQWQLALQARAARHPPQPARRDGC